MNLFKLFKKISPFVKPYKWLFVTALILTLFGSLIAQVNAVVLDRTVQNFFIDLLPLFTSAVLAPILMFAANVWVGLTALGIVPIYIWITVRQARKLNGWRRNMRSYREMKSHGIMSIIESINVIKSFNRERIESDKQWDLQTKFTDNQKRNLRRVAYLSSILRKKLDKRQ